MSINFLLVLIAICQVGIAIGMFCLAYSNRMVSKIVFEHYKKCTSCEDENDESKPEGS